MNKYLIPLFFVLLGCGEHQISDISDSEPSSLVDGGSSSSGGDESSSSDGGGESSSSVDDGSSSSGGGSGSSSSGGGGISYGSLPYEGQTYKTVKIGDQTWMAENLNYAVEGSRCYGDDPANCVTYGRLYDWETAMTVCPDGWHLPSDEEWTVLENAVGDSRTAGTKLKAATGNGTDDYGFSALLGGRGYLSSDGFFLEVGGRGYWWSATENGSNYVYLRSMIYGYSDVYKSDYGKSGLFSVRCVKNSSGGGGGSSSSTNSYSSSGGGSGNHFNPNIPYINFIDNRDGKTYKSVVIGTQTWMAENLNYAANGSRCYDDDPANCDIYGRLYDWSTARSACPSDWHLPSDAAWTTLTNYVGGSSIAGTKLKATSGWNNNSNGTDDYGFSALPGGFRSPDGSGFRNAGSNGYWWISREGEIAGINAYYWYIYGGKESAARDDDHKSNLFSLRCIKDITYGSFTDSRDGQSYKTVVVGDQTWMAENLNYNPGTGNSACYENQTSNCNKYGRLYDWSTAMAACPSGWHLPSDAAWTTLTNYVGGSSIAGTKLKATSGWNNNSNGTDNYGFSALPGGFHSPDGSGFRNAGSNGYWWISREGEIAGINAYYWYIYGGRESAARDDDRKTNLFSVRCIEDN